MIVVIIVVFHVLGLVSSINAIMTTRTEQGAIAWAVSLNTFPYVAVPAYWVLGRSRFQGYVTARRGEMAEIAGLTEDSREAVRAFKRPDEDISPAVRAAQRLAGLPYLTGNSVELLVDGDATFASILEGIDAAKDYILIQFFIVHDDEIGRQIKAHLVKKAMAGVRVYFPDDEVGSHDLPRAYKRELREAGAEVSAFNIRKGPGNRFQINFRNHRKVVVADGKVAWVGGHNVGDEYLGRGPKFCHWRDIHVRIQGPAALGAQLSFAEDWYWATERRRRWI
jgi:cardiolipin synthase